MILVFVVAVVALMPNHRHLVPGNHFAYTFLSKPQSRTIPNSVVFTYRVDPSESRPVLLIITNGVPLLIPVTAKGCTASLGLYNGTRLISAKSADLSGLGADTRRWVKIGCTTNRGKLEFLVNDQIAYSGPLPPADLKILGIGFGIDWEGSVKSVLHYENENLVFHVF
jgi:hypothetical protein